MKKFYGTGVALVTPFNEGLEIDYKSFKKLLNHTSKGVDYYVLMGTTGESTTCSEEEKADAMLSFLKGGAASLPGAHETVRQSFVLPGKRYINFYSRLNLIRWFQRDDIPKGEKAHYMTAVLAREHR